MIDFDAEGNLIRKLTSTASETDAAAAANDLLERLHHKKTEPTASELEQLAREAAGKVNRFYFDKTQKEVPYEIILSVCQRVQELTRMSAAKPTTGEWIEHYVCQLLGAMFTFRGCKKIADAHEAALAAEQEELEQMTKANLDWFAEVQQLREQLQDRDAAERQKVKALVDALKRITEPPFIVANMVAIADAALNSKGGEGK